MPRYRFALRGIALVALLLLFVPGALASVRSPSATVRSSSLEPVWGHVYRLIVDAEAVQGVVAAVEYRLGLETGSLFPVDGSADDAGERFETYLEINDAAEPLMVRVRSGGRWSDWAEVEHESGHSDPATGCALTAAGSESGWYRGAVRVDCGALIAAADAESLEYSVGFSDWIPVNGAEFTIEDEGVHWVQVRSIGADGLPGIPVTFSVALDATAPRVWSDGVRPILSHAETLELAFGAEDELSGVALTYAELGGELELQPGEPLELWRLPLGRYSLGVVAVDRAGNAVYDQEELSFTLTTDWGSMAKLVHLFAARAKLESNTELKPALIAILQTGQQSADRGDRWAARQKLYEFVEALRQAESEGRVFAEAAAALIADAEWMLERLEPDSGSAP